MKAAARWAVTVVVMVVLVSAAGQAAAGQATDTVRQRVDQIVAAIQAPGFKDRPREAQVAQIRQIINTVFDYGELSKRTLGKGWEKFSPEEQQRFIALFSELLEKTYADRVLAYTDEKIDFGKELELKRGRVEVESTIFTKDGKQVPLNYRLIQKDGDWRVYDVVIEGISLVQNYRSQFRDILAKKSPAELIATLEEKVKQ